MTRMLTLALACLVGVTCVSANPATSRAGSQLPTPIALASPLQETSPTRSGFLAAVDPGDLGWQYAGTLLLPTDPNTYANELLDVRPLADGGWVVIVASAAVRQLPTGGFIRIPHRPTARVIRLDAAGNVVAQQTDESFSPTHLVLFESSGVVVAEGAGTRGFDLRTLDTLWATDAECVVVIDHCFAYQPFTMAPPGTFEERDPRSFSMLESLPHVKVGQLTTPIVLPEWNLAVVQSKAPDHWFDFFPLDAKAPVTLPWIDRLTRARSIVQLSPDRVVVSYEGWGAGRFPATELTDIRTGVVLARYTDRLSVFSNESTTFLQGATPGEVLDPRDGSLGLVLATPPLYMSFEKGIAVVRLGNGGAAVLRRGQVQSSDHPVSFTKIAEASCAGVDFTRVDLIDKVDCPAVAAFRGERRILVSTGRETNTNTFDISGVSIDPATRRITIRVRVGERRSNSVAPSAPAQVIEISEAVRGRWLVGLEPDPATPRPFGFWTTFAIDLG